MALETAAEQAAAETSEFSKNSEVCGCLSGLILPRI